MTRGRTGSTAVMDSLNKTSSITTAQELFIKYKTNEKNSQPANKSDRVILRYDPWRQQNLGRLERVSEWLMRNDTSIVKYLDQVENTASKTDAKAFGFKVISHHFKQRPGLKENLVERGYSAIYLTRNIPRQVISGIVAKKRGKYNAHEKENYQNDSSFLIDIDNFKQFNDRYGHLAGDECLYAVAQKLADTVSRPEDFVARYGGEEFVVLLPQTDKQGALFVAEQIQKAIEMLAIVHEDSFTGYLSVSMGINTVNHHQCDDHLTFIQAADDALYYAKNQGRNCIALSPGK